MPTWGAALRPAEVKEGRVATLIRVHVSPGARGVSELRGYDEWRSSLTVAVAARCREGQANGELCRFLAELLEVSTRGVSIDEGHKSRDKVVRVGGVSLERVTARLARRL